MVWPSSWIRTLFFNSTRPKPKTQSQGQNTRVSPGLGFGQSLITQTNSSDRIDCPIQPETPKRPPNPRFCLWFSRVERPLEQNSLSDSTRRTKTRTRPILSNRRRAHGQTRRTKTRTRPTLPDRRGAPGSTRRAKGLCPTCPTLGLDAQARVQPTPTVTLLILRDETPTVIGRIW
jgi:hypothetical protein